MKTILGGLSGDFSWDEKEGTIKVNCDLAGHDKMLTVAEAHDRDLCEAIVHALNERDRVIAALKSMAAYARQWDRFNGVADGKTPEIEEAFKLIAEVEAT